MKVAHDESLKEDMPAIYYHSTGYVEYSGQRIYPKMNPEEFATRLAKLKTALINGKILSVNLGKEIPGFINFDYLEAGDIQAVFNIIEDWIFKRMENEGFVLQQKLLSVLDGFKLYIKELLTKEKDGVLVQETQPQHVKNTTESSHIIEPNFEHYLTSEGKRYCPI